MGRIARPNKLEAEFWTTGPVQHAALTATTTLWLGKVPAGRKLRIDRIVYNNATGLAADNTNAFKLHVMNDAAVVREVFNTDGNDDPVGVALEAGTLDLTPDAAEAVLDGGDELTAVFTEDGTATLPAGAITIEGRLL